MTPRQQRILDRLAGYATCLMAMAGAVELLPPDQRTPANATAKGYRRCPLFVAACVLGEPEWHVAHAKGGYWEADSECPLGYLSRRLAAARRRLREGKPPEVFNENLGQELDCAACDIIQKALHELRHWVRVDSSM